MLQVDEVGGQPLDGRALEQVGGIHQRGQHALFAVEHIQGQVELSDTGIPLQPFDAQGMRLLRLATACAALVAEQCLEQWAVAEVALRRQGLDQLLERQVLVGLGLQRRLAHLAGSAARTSALSTWVLTKKPIMPSVQAWLRLAIGTPTRMSDWPL